MHTTSAGLMREEQEDIRMHTTSAGCTNRPDEQDIHDVAVLARVLDRVPQQVALAGRSRGRTVCSNRWRVLWRMPLLPQLLPPPPPFFVSA